jgi:hypothetical protein
MELAIDIYVKVLIAILGFVFPVINITIMNGMAKWLPKIKEFEEEKRAFEEQEKWHDSHVQKSKEEIEEMPNLDNDIREKLLNQLTEMSKDELEKSRQRLSDNNKRFERWSMLKPSEYKNALLEIFYALICALASIAAYHILKNHLPVVNAAERVDLPLLLVQVVCFLISLCLAFNALYKIRQIIFASIDLIDHEANKLVKMPVLNIESLASPPSANLVPANPPPDSSD